MDGTKKTKKGKQESQLGFDFDGAADGGVQSSAADKADSTAVMEMEEPDPAAEPEAASKPSRRRKSEAATAESMAAKQRDISVSEFFAKNRHLLGFDNPRKALLTAVKEAVDNSLDACEEAHILPHIIVTIAPVDGSENKFRMTVKDNGPGIVAKQVPNIFARLLYGSKFHSLKMSRGQQGIGISAAGMYGLLTTGEPVQIMTRTSGKKPANHYHVQIDTTKNRPEVILDEECEFDLPHGTSVTITMEGRYQKGKQSIDEYLAQTAIANPHAAFTYHAPDGKTYDYPRQSNEMPFIPVEIKPHPYGVEVGVLFKMARQTEARTMREFLRSDFSRISQAIAEDLLKKSKLSVNMKPWDLTIKDAERLHGVINSTKLMAPPTDCIGPIGEEKLVDGLKRVVDAEFYTSCTRKPAVYRGNPFLVEAALAYGCKDASEAGNTDEEEDTGMPAEKEEKDQLMRLVRFANRVPLLYQQSACAIYKAVLEVNWRSYGLGQSRGALPSGPVMLMVHIASVWVPFTSESKEAVAHYPEIIKEIKLAVQECGRKLGMHVRKQRRIKDEMIKRGYIETYLPHIGQALKDILTLKDTQVEKLVEKLKVTLEKSRTI